MDVGLGAISGPNDTLFRQTLSELVACADERRHVVEGTRKGVAVQDIPGGAEIRVTRFNPTGPVGCEGVLDAAAKRPAGDGARLGSAQNAKRQSFPGVAFGRRGDDLRQAWRTIAPI